MSYPKRFDLMDPVSASFFYREASILKPAPQPFFSSFVDDELDFALDLIIPSPFAAPSSVFDLTSPSPFAAPSSVFDLISPSPFAAPSSGFDLPLVSPLDFFESAADHAQIDLAAAHFRRAETGLQLRRLSDRVAALEMGFDRGMRAKPADQDRKYKWMAEIKGPKGEGFDRKYKLTAVKGAEEKSVKWMAEITGKGKNAPLSRTYTFQASKVLPEAVKEKKEKKQRGKEARATRHVVEIEEPANPGAVVLKQAFAKRAINHSKSKRNELSPQDAALIIQMTFRAHLVRRSQALRGLRELAVAKAKLKEIRALFSNFSYRRRLEHDAEERQRFSEKIIVLLLTVDAIEGLDYIIRAAKRLMLVELEAMLEVVDPQPTGKVGSMNRRQFDLPAGGSISKEMAMGVAEVVQMLDEDNSSNALLGVSL